GARAPARVRAARRLSGRGGAPRRPHRVPPRRARGGGAGRGRAGSGRGAGLPEPALGPAVRLRPPREPARRMRGRALGARLIHLTFEREPLRGRRVRGDVRIPEGPPPRSAVLVL